MAKELGKFIRLAIFFYIIYLIFTNFGTFLIIIFVLFILIYFFIYKKLKSKNQFHFKSGNYSKFNDFNPNSYAGINDIKKAKDFFGFTSDPTKEEIKKTYKILARKYHPDINDHDDSLMKDLNHYKDILIKTYDKKN